MVSKCAYKLKIVKNEKGGMERAIRLRSVLGDFMDLEACDAETFPGAARRPSQRLFASAAARGKQWIIAPFDIDVVFLERGSPIKNLLEQPVKRNARRA
eukprot:9468121-Pyramimonas_sp.AAC.1